MRGSEFTIQSSNDMQNTTRGLGTRPTNASAECKHVRTGHRQLSLLGYLKWIISMLALARLASSTDGPQINLSIHLALDLHMPENSEECVVRKSPKEKSALPVGFKPTTPCLPGKCTTTVLWESYRWWEAQMSSYPT